MKHVNDRTRGLQPIHGFTLIELLVVVAIIAILIAILLPVLSKTRFTARKVTCGARLGQIYVAFSAYLQDYNDQAFWRANDIHNNGMEWYVYGGRETGNYCTDQMGLFNRVIPRPLNLYVSNEIRTFMCSEYSKVGVCSRGILIMIGKHSYIFNVRVICRKIIFLLTIYLEVLRAKFLPRRRI